MLLSLAYFISYLPKGTHQKEVNLKLELQFLGDNEMEKEYKQILNSEDYLIKLIEQLDRLNNKEQFMETGKTK